MTNKADSKKSKAANMTKKRKRTDADTVPASRTTKSTKQDAIIGPTDILELEEQIVKAPRRSLEALDRLNKICGSESEEERLVAGVSLCRIFCKFVIAGEMNKSSDMTTEQMTTLRGLKTAQKTYVDSLSSWLADSDPRTQSTSLTLMVRLLKQEVTQDRRRAEQAWRTGVVVSLVQALISPDVGSDVRTEFIEKHLETHDNLRLHIYATIHKLLPSLSPSVQSACMDSCLDLLLSVGHPSSTPEQFKALRSQAMETWSTVLSCPLSKAQRKIILGSMADTIVPLFAKPERLLDFLTDSYDEGGATSLLALSGLFFIMQEKNLDYPQFFPKLYSLLDGDLMHSKHRSYFFRLLDQFMSSTHLPAALVASFIKRLSRLALHGQPGGIVVVVPWVYNMLKRHPTCTFMIHRETLDPKIRSQMDESGLDDCFDMSEPDPMKTGAIDSCLWELETLQSHYHPNVATLAKIISEQFTKASYNLEDFLDHTYKGLIDAELEKDLKKAPVTEFEIPKRIFTEADGLDKMGGALFEVMQMSSVVA